MRKSQPIANSKPPPKAKPLTAAITGTSNLEKLLKVFCPRAEKKLPSLAVLLAISAISAPATKAFPSPVIMMARKSVSNLNSATA